MISEPIRLGKSIRAWAVLATVAGSLGCQASSGSTPPSPGVVTTIFGGSDIEMVRDITYDRDGGLIVVGSTRSVDFPTTPGVFDRSFNGTSDAFIAKVDSAGALVWSTYLGGPGFERAYAVEIDSSGAIYVAGRAGSGFPTTPGVFQPSFGGGAPVPPYDRQDGFVCKLAPQAVRIVFCSYFGTSDNQPVRDLVLAPGGDIYLAASVLATSTRLPAAWFARALQPEPAGNADGLIARITGDGTRVVWATYLGGSGNESGEPSIRLTKNGDPVVFYISGSPDAPTPNGWQRRLGGPYDAYVARLSSDGTRLIFGTYLGGSGPEMSETHNLWIDDQDRILISAGTMSPDFPVTPGAAQARYGGSGGRRTGGAGNYPGDAFVAKLSSDSGRVLAATFLGGTNGESVEGIAVGPGGRVIVSGGTYSPDLPVTPDAVQRSYGGDADGFFAILSPNLDRFEFVTYLGGPDEDIGRAATANSAGKMAFSGPAKAPILLGTRADPAQAKGGGDAFVIQFQRGVSKSPPE